MAPVSILLEKDMTDKKQAATKRHKSSNAASHQLTLGDILQTQCPEDFKRLKKRGRKAKPVPRMIHVEASPRYNFGHLKLERSRGKTK